MTSSMPWKRAPSCATGPHAAGMQLPYCLRWDGIPSNMVDWGRLRAMVAQGPDIWRDWEHFRGVAVSKTTERGEAVSFRRFMTRGPKGITDVPGTWSAE